MKKGVTITTIKPFPTINPILVLYCDISSVKCCIQHESCMSTSVDSNTENMCLVAGIYDCILQSRLISLLMRPDMAAPVDGWSVRLALLFVISVTWLLQVAETAATTADINYKLSTFAAATSSLIGLANPELC